MSLTVYYMTENREFEIQMTMTVNTKIKKVNYGANVYS